MFTPLGKEHAVALLCSITVFNTAQYMQCSARIGYKVTLQGLGTSDLRVLVTTDELHLQCADTLKQVGQLHQKYVLSQVFFFFNGYLQMVSLSACI